MIAVDAVGESAACSHRGADDVIAVGDEPPARSVDVDLMISGVALDDGVFDIDRDAGVVGVKAPAGSGAPARSGAAASANGAVAADRIV